MNGTKINSGKKYLGITPGSVNFPTGLQDKNCIKQIPKYNNINTINVILLVLLDILKSEG